MNADLVWTPVGRPEDLRFDPGAPVKLDGHWLAIFRVGDGANASYRAIDNACPHASAPLCDGTQMGSKVVCSLHLWEFDLETGACDVGADWSVATHPCRLRDGLLEVGLPRDGGTAGRGKP